MTTLTGSHAEALADQICARSESKQFETKRVSGKMVGKALEVVCAFANTEGGILALGVEDFDKAKGRARLFGLVENPEAVDELSRKLNTQFNPPVTGLEWIRLATMKREHSRKPDEFFPIVEGGSPGPFLELFARGPRKGWATQGNQADSYFPSWDTYANHSQAHLVLEVVPA